MLNRTVDIIKKYYEETKKEPVIKNLSPENLKKQINFAIKEKWENMDLIFDELEKIALTSPRTSSSWFFNLLFGWKILPAVMAEIITVVLNNTMHTYKSAWVQILVEKEVISYFLSKVGYLNWDWTFMPWGSLTNMTALTLARNEKNPSIKEKWIGNMKMVFYVSDQAHYSTKKFASLMWLGYESIKIIESDSKWKIRLDHLEEQIKSDLSLGLVPFCIVATAGTTVLWAFDSIREISKIAKKYSLWLHVDAALGWWALMSSDYKHLLDGIELSDSVARSQHKMMNIPLLAAVFLVKDPNVFYRNFSESADYLFQMDDYDLNPWTKTLQCGRRNDALKVRTALKYLWDEWYQKRINKEFENAQYAVSIIKKNSELELILEPEWINVCFCVKNKSPEKICNLLDTEWLIKVSYGSWQSKTFIRMICVDPDISFHDIDYFFDCIKRVSYKI